MERRAESIEQRHGAKRSEVGINVKAHKVTSQ
jgi:hypothetical protein